MPIRSRKFQSFVVVSDADYQRFLKAESCVLQAVSQPAKLRAVARSSQLVGSLLECPDCGRLLLTKPDGDSDGFYSRDD